MGYAGNCPQLKKQIKVYCLYQIHSWNSYLGIRTRWGEGIIGSNSRLTIAESNGGVVTLKHISISFEQGELRWWIPMDPCDSAWKYRGTIWIMGLFREGSFTICRPRSFTPSLVIRYLKACNFSSKTFNSRAKSTPSSNHTISLGFCKVESCMDLGESFTCLWELFSLALGDSLMKHEQWRCPQNGNYDSSWSSHNRLLALVGSTIQFWCWISHIWPGMRQTQKNSNHGNFCCWKEGLLTNQTLLDDGFNSWWMKTNVP